MKVKEESEKVGLKLNIQKMKVMASGPITSWAVDGETVETVSDFILKSILSDMSIATPAFYWSLFAWNIFFQPFTFSLNVSPVLRWVSCRQHI